MLQKDAKVFGNVKTNTARECLVRQRRKAARKLSNPRLLRITFHSIRHWKGTTLYHDTNNMQHVKYVLGHKNIQSTDVYVNLENALFTEANDKFYSAVAKTVDEARQRIEVGFDYVATTKEGWLLFKKRK